MDTPKIQFFVVLQTVDGNMNGNNYNTCGPDVGRRCLATNVVIGHMQQIGTAQTELKLKPDKKHILIS